MKKTAKRCFIFQQIRKCLGVEPIITEVTLCLQSFADLAGLEPTT